MTDAAEKATPVDNGSADKPAEGAAPGARKTVQQQRGSLQGKRGAPPKKAMWKRVSQYVVNNKWWTVATLILTIYALVGEDIRVMFTSAPADQYFNGFTTTALVIFGLDILLSCLGKEDYLLSFFFWLDFLSTLTLLFDLTWTPTIEEIMNSGGDAGDNTRTSRTARIGARAGRVVRVLRLVRIVKLYKVFFEARAKKKTGEDGADEEDWDDIEVDDDSSKNNRESKVGKKLSDLTTKRVIILVLLMMIILPLMTIDEKEKQQSSVSYGVDAANDAFLEYIDAKEKELLTPSGVNVSYKYAEYERRLLMFLYYHNWFQARIFPCYEYNAAKGIGTGDGSNGCSLNGIESLFWVGVMGTEFEKYAQETTLSKSTCEAWEQRSIHQRDMYQFGIIYPYVQPILSSPWTTKCQDHPTWTSMTATTDGKHALGFTLLTQEVMDKLEIDPDRGSFDQLVENPGGLVEDAVNCPADLRKTEVNKVVPSNVDSEKATHYLVFYFDVRQQMKQDSLFAIMLLLFVCFSLVTASIMFSNDANVLVLHPVENMISKVDTIRNNPLMAMKLADEEFKVEERNKFLQREKEKPSFQKTVRDAFKVVTCTSTKEVAQPMETIILEKTIIKLGSLLALGFGEAGASIIEHNMHGIDSACVDAMVEGNPVKCIIGAIRVRDFSVATEVLQNQIMTFVNQIAEIVHGVVDSFHGAANKNNGDMFLMIWRTSSVVQASMSKSKQLAMRAKQADMAMLAFARIMAAVHRSGTLASYRGHPRLQQRLGKNCRVNMGSALHYGWAIEGAVGSEFKIDASYLSPHVSLAESMERATVIYRVSILVADSVVQICSLEMAAKCRLIDKVIISGSVIPIELFVIDVDYMALSVEGPLPVNVNFNSRARFKARQSLEADKTRKLHDDVKVVKLFNEHPDISALRFRYTLEFMCVFNMGYQNYTQGEWGVAQRLLSRTRTMCRIEDGPSAALLRYMERPYQFQAPENWQGIRDLSQVILALSQGTH